MEPQHTTIAKARTAKATKARMRRYDAYVKKIRPALRGAREHSANNSVTIAEFLNLVSGVYAPNGKPWDKNSMLRALRKLKSRGLDVGSLPPHLARCYV